MGVLQILHDDFMLVAPVLIGAVSTAWLNSKKGWFGHPKTRRLNTEEHAANADKLDTAITFSKIAAKTAIRTDQRLTTHLQEDHPSSRT